jgi:hypothetical protein
MIMEADVCQELENSGARLDVPVQYIGDYVWDEDRQELANAEASLPSDGMEIPLPGTPDRSVSFSLCAEENNLGGPGSPQLDTPEDFWYDNLYEPDPDKTIQGLQVEFWVKHTGIVSGTDPVQNNYLIRDISGTTYVVPSQLVTPSKPDNPETPLLPPFPITEVTS